MALRALRLCGESIIYVSSCIVEYGRAGVPGEIQTEDDFTDIMGLLSVFFASLW